MFRPLGICLYFTLLGILMPGRSALALGDVIPQAPQATISDFTLAPQTEPSLTVHGHAELKVMPDVAYVNVTITTQSRSQVTASQDNATQSQAVREALKSSAIDDKDIQTQYYTISPQYDYQPTPVLTGYQATNSLQVTIHNVPKLGIIMDKAIRAGATEVGDVSFDVVDRHKVEGEALVDAISNARAKADLMAGAAGISLGRLLGLSEGTPPLVQPIFAGLAMARAASPAQASSTQVSPQQITVTADVTAVYSILPAR